ncbi:MAG TPA: NADH-quinone oxidoreductase subunit J [Levilinea sp.]|nr:NADH-quinone oxidoreductase subunit J [Levilinea sp.]
MLLILIAAGILVCALQAIRSQRLLYAAMWLSGTSALVALLMYMLGAPEVAVIELSVGAGLITVIFVFAINIAGDDTVKIKAVIPKRLAMGLILLAALLLGWFILPALNLYSPSTLEIPFITDKLWNDRTLDILLQVVMIFAAALGVLGLVSEPRPAEKSKS